MHPNRKLVAAIAAANDPQLQYQQTAVDAADLARVPAAGLKTMINSFQHLPPDQARKFLLLAPENRRPVFIYELAENKIQIWLWSLALPLSLSGVFASALLFTPLVKNLSLRQLAFTYLLPIIPPARCLGWPGFTGPYALADLDELLAAKPGTIIGRSNRPARPTGANRAITFRACPNNNALTKFYNG